MSRHRLDRGYWNGRQVEITEKESRLLFSDRYGDGRGLYHRHGMRLRMDYPFPTEFEAEKRLPRKTKKALWKHLNGHPETNPRTGVRAYNGSTWGIWWSIPGLFHNGRKA